MNTAKKVAWLTTLIGGLAVVAGFVVMEEVNAAKSMRREEAFAEQRVMIKEKAERRALLMETARVNRMLYGDHNPDIERLNDYREKFLGEKLGHPVIDEGWPVARHEVAGSRFKTDLDDFDLGGGRIRYTFLDGNPESVEQGLGKFASVTLQYHFERRTWTLVGVEGLP